MRCLSIATSLSKLGETVTFIVADKAGEAFLKNFSYPIICLKSNWENLDNEIEVMKSTIKRLDIKKLLIDSYFVTAEYLKELKKCTKIAYLDDLNSFPYTCDMLINYAGYAEELNYRDRYPGTKLLLGCSYVPLRKEFFNLPPKMIQKEIKSILVMSGGADQHHFVYKLMKEILDNATLIKKNFYIICGGFSEDYEKICGLVSEYKNLCVIRNTKNLGYYMAQADVAISAGGISLYELCAYGVPTISYSVAENQIRNVRWFNDKKLIEYFGDLREKENLSQLLDILSSPVFSIEERKLRSRKMQKLVNGNGSNRIAEELLEM